MLIEVLLQLLVGKVDVELLETVDLQHAAQNRRAEELPRYTQSSASSLNE